MNGSTKKTTGASNITITDNNLISPNTDTVISPLFEVIRMCNSTSNEIATNVNNIILDSRRILDFDLLLIEEFDNVFNEDAAIRNLRKLYSNLVTLNMVTAALAEEIKSRL